MSHEEFANPWWQAWIVRARRARLKSLRLKRLKMRQQRLKPVRSPAFGIRPRQAKRGE